jgi:hypothetical protein
MTTIIQPISPLGGFFVDNLSANRAEAPIGYSGSQTVESAAMAGLGEVYGYGVTLQELPTAGQLLVRARIDGVPLATQFDAGLALGKTSVFFRVTDEDREFAPGTPVSILVETVGLTPATVDMVVVLFVVFNRGVSTDDFGI